MFMFDAADMTERHAQVLQELAGMGMVIARELQAQVLGADTPEAKQKAAEAFPRLARAVRQTLALEAKVRRDFVRGDREDLAFARRELSLAARRRKAQVWLRMQRAIVKAAIAAEARDPDDAEEAAGIAEMRVEDLRDRLDDELLTPDFVELPFEEIIRLLHQALGMDPPDPDPDEDDDEDDEDDGDRQAPDAGDGPAEPPPARFDDGEDDCWRSSA